MNQPNGSPASQPGGSGTSAVPNGGLTLPIPGITFATGNDNQSPVLGVSGPAKHGKTTTVVSSLYGWPTPQHQPLVIAFDPTGSDACKKIGLEPARMKINEMAGVLAHEKMRAGLNLLEQHAPTLRQRFGAIVIDCASTAVEQLHSAASRIPKNANNPNTMAPYNEMGLWLKELMRRIRDIGLPSIWLSWQQEQTTVEIKDERTGVKRMRTIEGGPDLMGGKARNHYTGTLEHMFILERQKHQIGAPGADDEGYVRIFHSRPWNGINAGGRYAHLLPESCPPHMGWILSRITGRGPYAEPPPQQQAVK